MKILRDDEAPAPPAVESYQETQWSGLPVGIALLLAAAALVIWSLREAGWQFHWLLLIPGLLATILMAIGRLALRSFLASRRPESWRLRWSSGALYLRFRSYLNTGFPADTPALVQLSRREVDWLRPRQETLDVPNDDGGWGRKRQHRWLEIALRGVDLQPLKNALAAEVNRRDRRGGRFNDYPVTLTREGTLRLSLRQPGRVAEMLSAFFPVRPAEVAEAADFAAMSRDQREDHVLALAAAGDDIAAIKAAREVYGLDLTEAKRLVDELQGHA